MELKLSWKVIVNIPDGGPNYDTNHKLFTSESAKSLLKTIGGCRNLTFFPHILVPTNVFYNAIEKYKMQNHFYGKKFPFELTNGTYGPFSFVNLNIHLFSKNLIIISVKLSPINFSGNLKELERIIDIRNHKEVFNLTKTICGLIISGNQKSFKNSETPKSYPCVLVTDNKNAISDRMAVELLTRHKNVTANIIKNVLLKNDNHQLDESNIVLLDRQGVFARVKNIDTIKRKFASAQSMLELAIAISKILSDKRFFMLSEDHKIAVTNLINNPDTVFLESVTGQNTWKLLLNEFKLVELFIQQKPINQDKQITYSVLYKAKKCFIECFKFISNNALISGILLIAIGLYGASWYQNHKKINIYYPTDRKHVINSQHSCNFVWESIENAVDYKIVLQKFSSMDNNWKDLNDNSIYISKLTNKAIDLNTSGRYQWKIIARDKDSIIISESDFCEFIYELQEVKK